MTKIKLIATDMDGTLLNSKNEIHESFYETLNRLNKKGIIFAAASGRQYYNLLQRFEGVNENMMFIAENGTFVVYKGKELLVKGLEKELAFELIKKGRRIEEAYVVVCGKKSAYVEKKDARFIKEVEKYYARYKVVEHFEHIEDEILKVTICDFKGSEENSQYVFEDYKEVVQVTVSGYLWLDMTARGVNKGVAIKMVQEKLGISEEETMVFGDYLNDLEMMQSAYHSYAMANAHDDLKKVAKFIAKSNDENGVVEQINQMLQEMEV